MVSYVFNMYFVLSGTVLLDLEKFDLPNIAKAVVENMVLSDQLKQKDSNKVLTALLLRHRHQHQRRPSSKRRKKLAVAADNLGFNSLAETGNGVIRMNMNESNGDVPITQVCSVVLM